MHSNRLAHHAPVLHPWLILRTVCILLAASAVFVTCGDDPLRHLETAKVVAVRDGDTIELSDGRAVRYIGIDTPEIGEYQADTATAFNAALVLGKIVKLEYGRDRLDRYGRTLAFVFVGRRMVNMELLKAGLAWCYFFEGNYKYADQMVLALQSAMQQHRGLWSVAATETDTAYVGSFRSFRFHRTDCPSVDKIKEDNLVFFPARDSAIYSGFAPCGYCHP
jgi:micrococcal nuclease